MIFQRPCKPICRPAFFISAIQSPLRLQSPVTRARTSRGTSLSLENSSTSVPRCHVPYNSPVFSVCSIRRWGSVACTTPSYSYRYGRSPAPTDHQHTGSEPRRPLARSLSGGRRLDPISRASQLYTGLVGRRRAVQYGGQCSRQQAGFRTVRTGYGRHRTA